jgi:hypothetical protein
MGKPIFTSKLSLADEAAIKIAKGNMKLKTVDFSRPILSGRFGDMSQQDRFDAVKGLGKSDLLATNLMSAISVSGKYGGGFHVPMKWADGKTTSVSEKILSGAFMSSNTLPADWQNLWDALRIDVTVKKAAIPTIRQFIYNITSNANYTRTLKPTELGRVGIVFEDNHGHGQAVPQGEILGGGYETFDINIKAAGFTWDLLGELFDNSISPDDISTAVLIGHNALKDDEAISPIINHTYAVEALTAASTVGTGRQELLYNTLVDAKDDMRKRVHPATGRKLDVSNLLILASAWDSENILEVSGGLPSVQDKTLNAISQIKRIIAYEGEDIELRDRTVSYDGIPEGTAFMLIPYNALPKNGYMEIAVKRDLVVETDMQPNVNNLSRQQNAWWYAEGIWYKGIQYFVQKITLPAW